MSAVPAEHPPLRRDVEHGIVAGVCSGVANRLGIDPIMLRVVVAAATLAGGTGLIVYLLAWALVPEQGGRSPAWARLVGRRESWLVLSGSGMLLLSVLLLLREWGLWFSDAIAWPVLLAVGGAALIWRQSAASAPTAEPRAGAPGARAPGPPGRPAARAAAADPDARPGGDRRGAGDRRRPRLPVAQRRARARRAT